MAQKEQCELCDKARKGAYGLKCSEYGREPIFDEKGCTYFEDRQSTKDSSQKEDKSNNDNGASPNQVQKEGDESKYTNSAVLGQEERIVSTINKKVQHTRAEDVLGILASIIFWGGTILCGLGFLIGLIIIFSHIGLIYEYEHIMGATICCSSVLLYISVLVSWASLKMCVNISRNIFIIKDELLELMQK